MTEKMLLIKRDDGFTLVEMMVALVILSVSILALTSVTITAMKVNLDNDTRNAAVRLTGEITEDLFIVPFDSLVSSVAPHQTRTVQLRGATKDFTVKWTVTSTTATLKQILIVVSYDIKGKTFTNRSVVYRPSET
jgi:prepilin-type N-terminal cleavage/methylation domain-containing protein